MSTEQNKAVVRRFFDEIIGEGSDRAIEAIIASNCVGHLGNGDVEGEAFKKVLRGARTTYPDMSATILDMVAEGDKVACRFYIEGTHKSGKHVRWNGTNVYRVVDGQITDDWAQEDVFSMMQQLGVIPTPGGAS